MKNVLLPILSICAIFGTNVNNSNYLHNFINTNNTENKILKENPIQNGDTSAYEYGTLQYFYGSQESYSVIDFSDINDDVYYVDNWFCISFENAEISPTNLYFNELNMYYEFDGDTYTINENNFLITTENGSPLETDNHYYNIKPNQKYLMYFNLSTFQGLLDDTTFWLYEQYDNTLAGVNYSLCSFGGLPIGKEIKENDVIYNFNISTAQMYALKKKMSYGENNLIYFKDYVQNIVYKIYASTTTNELYFISYPVGGNAFFNVLLNDYYSYTFDFPVTCDVNNYIDLFQTDTTAYDEGREDGYQDGYDDGRDAGAEEGWDEGHVDGYNEGYADGTTDGYNTGLAEGLEGITYGPLDAIGKVFTSMASILNIEILPGITLGFLVALPVVSGVLIWLVWLLKR